MKSVRLDEGLETKLRVAARLEGVSESALIRQAIEQRCDAILSNRADLRLANVIGKVYLGGGVVERTGEAFTELLLAREEVLLPAAAKQG
ncbi:MAG TPA: CopG family transcriptional regulator, partial [Chloroflexota bacterium]|nr:CopG family transcriptional regulator [Chloroflexota bacterium]